VQEDEYVEKFKPYLMDVVAAWCKGAPFGDLCQMTDIYEGRGNHYFLGRDFISGMYVITLFYGKNCFAVFGKRPDCYSDPVSKFQTKGNSI